MIIQTKNTTSPVILVAIVALGIILGYFYYKQVVPDQSLPASSSLGGAAPVSSGNSSAGDVLDKLKDLKLDFSGLDLQAFKNLGIFGESPVNPGPTGRSDIFAPF